MATRPGRSFLRSTDAEVGIVPFRLTARYPQHGVGGNGERSGGAGDQQIGIDHTVAHGRTKCTPERAVGRDTELGRQISQARDDANAVELGPAARHDGANDVIFVGHPPATMEFAEPFMINGCEVIRRRSQTHLDAACAEVIAEIFSEVIVLTRGMDEVTFENERLRIENLLIQGTDDA